MSELDGVTPGEPLTSETLGADPIAACSRWLDEAYEQCQSGLPNAVCLSTVDGEGWPQGRIMLVKSVDPRGVVFFTNYRSPKGRALEQAPRAAVTFYWPDLQRQIRVRGSVERVGPEESDAYFRTRHRGSQIGAWASEQSQSLESREVLEARCRAIERRFDGKEIARPDHWGGYVLEPMEIEFWQGREDRLHDRILFALKERDGAGGWTVQRINP